MYTAILVRADATRAISLRNALVILKRTDTLKRTNAGYRPAGAEKLRISAAFLSPLAGAGPGSLVSSLGAI